MTVQNSTTQHKKKQQAIHDGLTGASAATLMAYCSVAKGMKTFYIRRFKQGL